MKSPLLLLLFVFYTAYYSYAQSSHEDQNSMRKIEYFGNINIDSMEYYAKALTRSSNTCFSYIGRISLANVLYKRGLYIESEKELLHLLSEIDGDISSCQTINKLNILNRLFWIKKNTGNYEKAFDLLVERKKLIPLLDQKNSHTALHLLSTDINMSMMKSDIGLYKEAIKILLLTDKKVSNLSFSISNTKYYHLLNQRSSLYNILGNNYLQLEKLDSAKYYYKRAYEITQKFDPPHKDSEALYRLRIAKVLIKEQEYTKALMYINNSNFNTQNLSTSEDVNFLKSVIFNHISKPDSAIAYSYRFLRQTKKTPSTKKNKIVIFNILAEQYDQVKAIDSAYKYSQLAVKELTALRNSKEKASRSHYLYDYNRVNQLNESITERASKNRLYIFILVFGVVSISGLSIYYSYKRKKKLPEQYDSISEDLSKKVQSNKKKYTIDKSLEAKVLQGLDELEKSNVFIDCDFSIHVLAKNLHTNTSYLSSIINEKKGKTFKQYIAELRINYLIKELTINQKFRKFTIKALAQEIGYTNASAFTRAFKKHTGKTPSEFLNELP